MVKHLKEKKDSKDDRAKLHKEFFVISTLVSQTPAPESSFWQGQVSREPAMVATEKKGGYGFSKGGAGGRDQDGMGRGRGRGRGYNNPDGSRPYNAGP